MKKLFFIILISFLCTSYINAQYVAWAKQVNSTGFTCEGRATAVDASGNVYTTGYFDLTGDFDTGPGVFNLTSAGGHDIFVLKLDASGNFVWAKSVGGPGQDIGESIALDATGNVYITGIFADTADFDPGPGVYNLMAPRTTNVFVEKLDSSGNFVWARQIGDSSSYNWAYGTAADSVGNVYLTGFFDHTVDFDPGSGIFNLTSKGSSDIFVLKLDASGNFVWAKQIGDTLSDQSFAIAVDRLGNVYTTGLFQGTVDFDPGVDSFYLTTSTTNTIFISKLDPSGNFVWAKQAQGTGADWGNSITVDTSCNIYHRCVYRHGRFRPRTLFILSDVDKHSPRYFC
jgi:hypothetical protein